ncbi:HEAT repeat domain-containing protein [Mangrovibacterium marinum]|uniref:HEAT repeat protein n=1 Tax=Mangrovibacterium marinum TaxID=1639118 RepID=A0A2T5BXZ2_9BACT|nr:HEAT repeat domain-containing protein [Mangrovibacterium marinum]PTN05959.1 hypothetical protein C8N47_12422 [Mangrovibacterium marinum]
MVCFVSNIRGSELMQAMGLYERSPFFIQLAIVFVFLLVLSLIIIYTVLFNRKFTDYLSDIREARWKPITQDLLIEIISETQDLPRNKAFDVDRHLHKFEPFRFSEHNHRRRILINSIVDLREQLSGNTKKILLYIYLKLNLQKDAIRDLDSLFPRRVIRAITELNKMGYVLEDEQMQQLLTRKNKYIYHVARTYYFLYHSNFSIDVLVERGEKLSAWDEMELFSTISQLSEDSVPQFAQWITPQTPEDLVALSARLAVHFLQFDAACQMHQLLDTCSDWLKIRLINAIGKLMQAECEKGLIARYPNEENPEIKKEILKALGRTGGDLSPDFLVRAFLDETDFNLKKHAALSAFKSMPMAEIRELPFFDRLSTDETALIQYIKNPLINFN